MKNWKKILAVILIFCGGISQIFAAEKESIRVICDDSIAGLAVKLRSSITTPNVDLIFRVKKPDASILQIPIRANQMGVAETELAAFHTKNSGVYEIAAAVSGASFENSPITTLRIFPSEISPNRSQVSIDPSSIFANGNERAILKITLRDEYENPIPNKSVIAISSRDGDQIQSATDQTLSDKNGNLFFEVSSQNPGISYFTVVSKMGGAIFSQRAKLVLIDPNPPSENSNENSQNQNPQNYLSANLFSDLFAEKENLTADLFDDSVENNDEIFGVVDHFEIDFPEKVAVASDQNFLKIVAKDSENRTVKNYTGTIIISIPNDENATLPNDGKYTFREQDEGEKTFDLALIFSKTGSQKIQVFDFNENEGTISQNISGEKTIEVAAGQIQNPNETSSILKIKKPSEGSVVSNSNLIIVGKGRPNTNLEITIDDIKMAEVELDADGLFTREIQNISDGAHEIFVREVDGFAKSEIVNFRVETALPTLDEFKIFPDGEIAVGKKFTVTVRSAPDLEKVQFSAGAILENLPEDATEKGKYSLTISAGETVGQFPITISLVDKLQKKLEKTNLATLKIVAAKPKLPTPTGVVATALNSGAEISWDEIDDLEISKVRIYGGVDKNSLQKKSEVDASKNSAKITNLKNDEKYFFAISFLNSAGDESPQSGLSSAIPQSLHSAANEFSATAGNGKIFLRWNSIKNVALWEILISVDGVNFNEKQSFSAAANSAVFENLIAGQKYFFRLVPKNANGIFTGDIFPQTSATPLLGNLSANLTPTFINNYAVPTNPANGPAEENIFFSSLILAAIIFVFKKYFPRRRFFQK